ncbi:YjiH family protein [Melghirimyces algeriensis]|uniref:Nucleoside recognition GATE domain-containing membrane protein YjiH n=1 Tax=Melghirimyces algeriensis TaxID=910412 RepID=A0A521CTL1_9BACL|nr:YjiH family protein [Melghirimyces algeriensis]SMO62827.1 nucleoside recognition GATE domain-containing membrane protein YjiH [Melghirimyces algeriensis]
MKNQLSYSWSDYLKFLIPSLIGILLFMTPIPSKDGVTIPVAVMAGWLQEALGDTLPHLMTFIILLTVMGSLLAKTLKPSWIMDKSFFKTLFDVSPFWLVVRILGLGFAVLTLYKIGPEEIWSEATGGLLLFDLIPVLFSVFLFAGFFLPLLMNFGLLEFCGMLLFRVMRPLFTLPGRSAIDCIASWLGDGTVGVLLTNKQYEEGFYSKREAAVIGTTFSVVSITFSIVVLSQMELEHLFLPYYLTIVVAGFVAAIIMPRIFPLSRKSKSYYKEPLIKMDETIPEGYTALSWGSRQAVDRAQKQRFADMVKGGIQNVLDMWMGVIPVVMAMGTVALIIAEHTPVFKWLGEPFVPLLTLLQVPEAGAAAQTIVIGFADMFLPSVIGSGIIESEMTRFIIASLSVTQLIYMSEVGGLLLGSKIPVNFFDLILIFLLRTLITLPVIALMAHMIF